MLENKKGFTLIELIAVVAIMAIISLIATPNIVSMMDSGNKGKYIADAEEFISKAVYMYKQNKYKDDTSLFAGGTTIKLKNIENIKDPKDPYGYFYDLEKSYVKIVTEPTSDGITKRNTYIYLKSCKADEETTECYEIGTSGNPKLSTDLTEEDVRKSES